MIDNPVRFSVVLTADEVEQTKRVADKLGTKASPLVRQVLTRFLESFSEQHKATFDSLFESVEFPNEAI